MLAIDLFFNFFYSTVEGDLNENLFQLTVLSQSDTADQLLGNVVKFNAELAKLEVTLVEHRKIAKDLNKELQQTLEFWVNSLN